MNRIPGSAGPSSKVSPPSGGTSTTDSGCLAVAGPQSPLDQQHRCRSHERCDTRDDPCCGKRDVTRQRPQSDRPENRSAERSGLDDSEGIARRDRVQPTDRQVVGPVVRPSAGVCGRHGEPQDGLDPHGDEPVSDRSNDHHADDDIELTSHAPVGPRTYTDSAHHADHTAEGGCATQM